MSTSVSVRADGVAVITLQNAPVNALAQSVCDSLTENVNKCVADAQVKAIVVTGEGNFFSGGADITEFALITMTAREDMPNMLSSGLHAAVNAMDASPKTVVAAINGQALGGGCEVALGAHYRVAHPKAKVGTPEVMLGLLPGGQGTQRLPRIAPLEVAMQMILMGSPLTVAQAKKAGVVDLVCEADENVVDIAAEFALSKRPHPISKRPVPVGNKVKAIAGGLDMALMQADKAAKGMIAPAAIINCIRAACLGSSFEQGVKVENEEFLNLLFSVQSKAMRHLFGAERAAAKIPGKAKPAPVKSVGIVGAGLMGGGIAMCFIQKGIPVVLKDAQQDWLDAGMKKVEGLYADKVKKGKMTKKKFKGLMALIKPTLDYKDFADVDLVIEAVPEIMTLKKEVFAALDAHCKPSAYIMTNTSGLNIDEIAATLKDPSRCMGAHFFSPANVMPLLENVRTAKASPECLSTAMAVGRTIGKKAVLVGNCDGFVGNRMLAPYGAEAKQAVEDGATFEMVDAAMTDFGMAMGPMSLGDLVGQELFWKQRKAAGNMSLQTKTSKGPYELVDWICDKGRFGLKTPDASIKANGRGIFIHRGRSKEVDPEVVAQMEVIRKAKGVTARPVSNEEVVERCMYSMVNEGFRILEEGYAQRASDVDIIYIFGYGFPAAKGGPMFWAENYVGFAKIVERLQYYDKMTQARIASHPSHLPVDYFQPSKLLLECAAAQGKEDAMPGTLLIDTILQQKKESKAKL